MISDELSFTCLDKAKELKGTKMPSKLYRYRSLETADGFARTIHSIRSGTIYCARGCDLNDPFELQAGLSSKSIVDYFGQSEALKLLYTSILSKHYDEEKFSNAINSDNWLEKVMELVFNGDGMAAANYAIMPEIELLNDRYKEIFSIARIACFTEKSDNLPMWANYSDNHKGICLEYDVGCLEQTITNEIYPVNYTSELFDAVKFGFEQQRKQQLLPIGLMHYLCTQKLKDWEYEKEWRYIFHPGTKYPHNNIPLDYRNRGEEVIFSQPSKIILGNKISTGVESELRRVADEQKIIITKMKITPYGLEEDTARLV